MLCLIITTLLNRKVKVETPRLGFELFRRLFHLPQKMPRKIQIEITNRCNLNCEICPRKKFNLPNNDIDIIVFEQILTKLKNVEVILPVGWGESFLHKDFDFIVNTIKLNGFLIKLPTNGIVINNKQAIDTALKIDFLTFSIDELHNNENKEFDEDFEVFNTIELLIRERNRRNSRTPYITVQSVLHKSNNKIFDIIRKAKSIEVDRINIVRPNVYDSIYTPNWNNRKNIYKKAELLSKQLKIRVDMFEYALFTGIKRWFWKYFKGLFRINSWCPRLSDFLYVTIDGKVTPCCYLPRYIVGDLMTQSLNDIWHGNSMARFRQEHKQICQNCQILKIK